MVRSAQERSQKKMFNRFGDVMGYQTSIDFHTRTDISDQLGYRYIYIIPVEISSTEWDAPASV